MALAFLDAVSFWKESIREAILCGMAGTRPDHVDAILEQWRRERPDVDTAALGLIGRLHRAAVLTNAPLVAGLGEHGLQPGWFDLLAALRRSGPPYELNPTQLMRATLLSSGGMTKRLDRLVEAGLIQRRPDPADRRGVLVGLTRRGRAVVDEALGPHVANEERLLRSLSRADRRALDDVLRTLLVDLESGPG
jgi:DNA-binding MarR family transcriptional regulator